MEHKTYMKLRCGATFFNIYIDVNSFYYASVYGQLPLYKDEDVIRRETMIDLIIVIILEWSNVNIPLEIYDETTKIWSKF